MELNEALNVATQMKNHYKAFEKIKEVIEIAVSMEANKGDLNKMIQKLNNEIELLKKEKSSLSIENLEMVRTDAARRQEKENTFINDFKKFNEDLDKKKKQLTNDYDALKFNKESEIKEFNKTIKSLEEEKKTKESLITSLNSEISRLKTLFS